MFIEGVLIMMDSNNYENLKSELEKSDNVKEVVKIREEEDVSEFRDRVRFTVETNFHGYGFDLLHSKFPSFEIGDVIVNENDDIEFVCTVEVLS